jgi:hypothetical protein
MAVKTGKANSPVSASFITITNPGIVANPVISPGTGTFGSPQMVTITTTTGGAQIFYTTTGNNPVVGTGFTRLYTGPFLVPITSTIKAIGVSSGASNSGITSVFLTITNPTPTVSTPVITPGTGTFAGAQSVNITCATPGSTIFFTTTGNTPVIGTGFTRTFTAPFVQSTSRTIRAMATAPGFNNSAVAVSFITIGAAREAVNDESEIGSAVGNYHVFPNPSSSGRFQVVSTKENVETSRFSVYSVDGKALISGNILNNNVFEIDLSLYPAGLYILKIQDSNNLKTMRLSKP